MLSSIDLLLDLVLPRECGGCEASGTLWCSRCREELRAPPVSVRPRVDPGVPCWALGPYSGPRRSAVLALKERNRADVAGPLGQALAGALTSLRMHGELDAPQLSRLVLIAAPSRARAARSRGGDHVRRVVQAVASALGPEVVEVPAVLRMGSGVRDSVGLSAAERAVNVGGKIALAPRRASATDANRAPRTAPTDTTVVLVDDVLTTGTTATECVRVLRDSGVHVDGVLVVAAV